MCTLTPHRELVCLHFLVPSQPLDVTKTRLQLDKTGRYTGMIDCGRKIVAQEGALSLYK